MSEDKTTKKKIEGRVAQILNARELVINIGSKEGVKERMKFAILAEKPIEVKDPSTNEVLDYIDREKVRVEASEVREKITICRTYRIKRSGGTRINYGAAIAQLLEPAQDIPETLDAKSSSLPRPLSPEESYVKINDRVIHVSDD